LKHLLKVDSVMLPTVTQNQLVSGAVDKELIIIKVMIS
jgi:hypothetical protein